MCSPAVKSAPNFPSLLSFSMETLFVMCDDQDSNVRLVADECLNRIIRVRIMCFLFLRMLFTSEYYNSFIYSNIQYQIYKITWLNFKIWCWAINIKTRLVNSLFSIWLSFCVFNVIFTPQWNLIHMFILKFFSKEAITYIFWHNISRSQSPTRILFPTKMVNIVLHKLMFPTQIIIFESL